MLQLESAAAYVAKIFAEEADGRVVGDGGAGLVDLLFGDEHAAGKDERLRAFAGGGEAAVNEKFVDA